MQNIDGGVIMMEEKLRKRKRKKKNKRKVRFLWLALLTSMIIVGVSWGGFYHYTHKDIQASDIGLDSDFFDFSEFNNDSDTTTSKPSPEEEIHDPTSDSETKTREDNDPSNKGSVSKSSEKSAMNNNSSTTIKTTKEEQIKAKYTAIFQDLQSIAMNKIDQLASRAIVEYKQGKSITSLSSTYMSAANKLQEKVDEAFYQQLDRMKSELKANGLSNDLAIKAESTYKKAIAEKKSEMMDKVVKFK